MPLLERYPQFVGYNFPDQRNGTLRPRSRPRCLGQRPGVDRHGIVFGIHAVAASRGGPNSSALARLRHREKCASNVPESEIARFASTNLPRHSGARPQNGATLRAGTIRAFGYWFRRANHPPSRANRWPANSRPARRSRPSAAVRPRRAAHRASRGERCAWW